MILKEFLTLRPSAREYCGQRVNGALLNTENKVALTFSENHWTRGPHVVVTLELVHPWVRENVNLPDHLQKIINEHLSRKAAFEGRQSAREDRLLERAEKAERISGQYQQASGALVEGIPLGQPILVGHHSERRHRRTVERSHAAMGKSVEFDRKAKHLKARAASVGTAGVSSDDPDGRFKLQDQLEKRQEQQDLMKAANNALRKDDDAALRALGFSDTEIQALKEPDRIGGIGFADYQLRNNNAQIRRLKARIAELKAASQREDFSRPYGEGITLELDTVENRIRLVFAERPSRTVRQTLKRNGFNFSRVHSAWQRKVTESAVSVAERLAEQLKGEV